MTISLYDGNWECADRVRSEPDGSLVFPRATHLDIVENDQWSVEWYAEVARSVQGYGAERGELQRKAHPLTAETVR